MLEIIFQLDKLFGFCASFGFWPAYLVYYNLEKVLPTWALFSGSHVWWHNGLLAVVWLGLFLCCFFLFRRYARSQVDMLITRAWYLHRVRLFTGWVKKLCLIAVYGSLLIPYLKLPLALLWVTGGCGVAVIVYDIVRAKAGAPFVLLQQFYLSVMYGVYLIAFAPILMALIALACLMMMFGSVLGTMMSPNIMVTSYFGANGEFLFSQRD